MNATATTGTVKVGRWTYPATLETGKDGFPLVFRNEKRDGSGDMIPVDTKTQDTFEPETPAKAVADEPFEYEAPEGVAAVLGEDRLLETTLANAKESGNSADYELARLVFTEIFSLFAATADEIRVDGVSEKRSIEVARHLEGYTVHHQGQDVPLVVRDKTTEASQPAQTIWQSYMTHDYISLEDALAEFDRVVPRDLVIKSRKTVKPVNNTHSKPGKSTWAVGTPCPQGHTLEDGDVYVMPSGRKQCRKCRSGYPSNL